MAYRDRQHDLLAELRERLAEGVDDCGRPLSREGMESLANEVWDLEFELGLTR